MNKKILGLAALVLELLAPVAHADCVCRCVNGEVRALCTSSLDLEPMHNPHASIVHRADPSAIYAVMIGGKIVHGKL